ncbi:MAG: CHAT domain-containing protein [Spirochaetota bacterium]|nr:CHAT domain-containing protein [Spirochaetota bacterium]
MSHRICTPKDVLELSLSDSQNLQIKLIQFYPVTNIITHNLVFNKSLYEEIINKIESIRFTKGFLPDEVKKLGECIFKLFFFDSNGNFLRGLDLVFERESILVLFFYGIIENIPLELAFNKNQFAGLKRCISRSVSLNNEYLGIYKDNVNDNKKSLLIIADPLSNSNNSYKEGLAIYTELSQESAVKFNKIDFVSKKINKTELVEFLESYDFIHFAGHGEYLENHGGALLIGEKTLFREEDLVSLKNPPDFIFLNACLSGRINSLTHGSLISKLLKLGVKNIIASTWIILDEDFSLFVQTFYKMILLGESVGNSFTKVKMDNFLSGDHKWIYFSLYGNPENTFYK